MDRHSDKQLKKHFMDNSNYLGSRKNYDEDKPTASCVTKFLART